MIPAAPLTGIAASLNKPATVKSTNIAGRVSAGKYPALSRWPRTKSVVYEGAFGFRDMAAASHVDRRGLRIASMVKLLTSVAALQLVERGNLKRTSRPAIDRRLGRLSSRRFRCERGSATAPGKNP
jgi:hypothetical protein